MDVSDIYRSLANDLDIHGQSHVERERQMSRRQEAIHRNRLYYVSTRLFAENTLLCFNIVFVAFSLRNMPKFLHQFTKMLQLLVPQTPYRGFAPGPHWGLPSLAPNPSNLATPMHQNRLNVCEKPQITCTELKGHCFVSVSGYVC